MREAIVFALEGLGAAGFLYFAISGHLAGMVGSLACMAIAVVLLLSHLGKPMLAWRAILNVRRSWISRGTASIALFIFFGGLYVCGQAVPALSVIQSANIFLLACAGVTATFILFYPGLAMRSSAGIAFWASPMLPVLSFFQGHLTGRLVSGAVTNEPVAWTIDNDFNSTCLALIILIAGSMYSLMRTMKRRGGASRVSSDWLIKEERLLFWGLAVGLGLVLPMGLIVVSPSSTTLLVSVVLARIVGDVAFRYAVLKVGAFESVA